MSFHEYIPRYLCLLLWFAIACEDGVVKDTGHAPLAADEDRDGYSVDDGDCDDTDPEVNPGAEERCNGVDDDCDGLLDGQDGAVDASTWYRDADGDSFGDPNSSRTACNRPDGYVALVDGSAGDCEDDDAAINPSAQERCNGIDDDCDGLLDDQDEAVDMATWYQDSDGDGYGDAETANMACEQPEGRVAQAGDCDDHEPAIHPGGDEVCGDGIDNDCDGDDENDCCVTAGGLYCADALLMGEQAGDAAGHAVASAGDVNADGHLDLLVGAPTADGSTSGDGVAYLFLGPVFGSMSMAEADGRFTGNATGDEVGYEATGIGDINRDGFDDLLIGAGEEGHERGGVYLLLGPVSGRGAIQDFAHAHLIGESTGARTGRSVHSAGDNDGDGIVDLLVGASFYNTHAPGDGAAYLVHGPVTGEYELASADVVIHTETDDELGSTVRGVGDLDADGLDDFIVGAKSAGTVYVFLGPTWGDIAPADADAALAKGGECCLGYSSSGAGDTNGDGYTDLMLSGTSMDGLWFFLGPVGGFYSLYDDHDAVIEDINVEIGRSQAPLGDLDQDGFDDILVSAPGDDFGGHDAGAVYVFMGPVSGAMGVSAAQTTWLGAAAGDKLGYYGQSINSAGDMNADGQTDIVLGSEDSNLSGSRAGCVYLLSWAP